MEKEETTIFEKYDFDEISSWGFVITVLTTLEILLFIPINYQELYLTKNSILLVLGILFGIIWLIMIILSIREYKIYKKRKLKKFILNTIEEKTIKQIELHKNYCKGVKIRHEQE